VVQALASLDPLTEGGRRWRLKVSPKAFSVRTIVSSIIDKNADTAASFGTGLPAAKL
jgi:hypothetical protein